MSLTNPTEELLAALGADVVILDEAARFGASFDNARLSFMPEALVRPRDEDDVAKVLALANRHSVPVTPRGAGSATTGAASPLKGGWVLDMSGWKNLHIDSDAGLAYVQPGVVTADINAEAEKLGWCYPPDPSSHKYCTIGGNIACNAGGMRAAKYGVTRDFVMALEGFLPTGEWVRWGADLRKYASGYNLRDLWIGSEGTLGVITGAVLKLLPKPEARATFLMSFSNEKVALEASRAIIGARLNPSIMEFLDRQSVRCTLDEGLVLPFDTETVFAPALLLVELDGAADAIDLAAGRLEALMKGRAVAFRRAKSVDEAELLWSVRRKCSKAMFRIADGKLNEDIVIPPRSQDALIDFTLELKERTGLATPIFGHAADGNFHVHIMYRRRVAEECALAEKAVAELMGKVVELGGAISGEHGIGLSKTPFLRLQHSEAEIGAMLAIKRALDPRGILNPGKIFEPFRVWEHEIVRVTLPWD
ncbi:MAG: FAD-binding protein [Opitutales bacterium]|nr:FAD-binding protein [Opitutales bacterium]